MLVAQWATVCIHKLYTPELALNIFMLKKKKKKPNLSFKEHGFSYLGAGWSWALIEFHFHN